MYAEDEQPRCTSFALSLFPLLPVLHSKVFPTIPELGEVALAVGAVEALARLASSKRSLAVAVIHIEATARPPFPHSKVQTTKTQACVFIVLLSSPVYLSTSYLLQVHGVWRTWEGQLQTLVAGRKKLPRPRAREEL